MVVVAQLVRAPDCGSGGRRFEPGLPPIKLLLKRGFFFNKFNFSLFIKLNRLASLKFIFMNKGKEIGRAHV